MMWGRQTAPRGLAAKPQILRRAPLWSAPAGRLYGSGLLPTQDTIELPLAFCPRIQQGAVSPTWRCAKAAAGTPTAPASAEVLGWLRHLRSNPQHQLHARHGCARCTLAEVVEAGNEERMRVPVAG